MAHDDDLGARQRGIRRFVQQLVEMGNLAVDVFLVLAQQPRDLDELVVDGEIEALAEQLLGQHDQRRVAQVVGAGLERQAKQRDRLAAGGGDQVVGAADVGVVAVQQRAQHGNGHALLAGDGQEALDLLRQAGATEREAGAQIGLGDVELLVLAEQRQHVTRIQAGFLQHGTGLVGEHDLQRMEDVAEVLDRFGDAHIGGDEAARHAGVEAAHDLDTGLVQAAHDGLRRVVEVRHRRALAQELGVEDQRQTVTDLAARGLLQQRRDARAGRAGRHSTADDQRVVAVLLRNLGADLADDCV
mmetsp:Transcript_39193/g.92123  ORF Transcript_39193/g.92123 Transcript_39193/m.92123 type:complete len:300 (+) Transcript_39193:1702-2601(+)